MSEHDRLGPPPVEPLSEVAWARVERGLWSRMDAEPPAERAAPRARPRRWIWIAAPALAAAAAAIAIVIGGGDGRPPGDGPARLVSGGAPTSLSYGDVHVTLDADSAVVMDRAQGAVLERGGAWFAVAPRRERAAFVVAAGDTVVRVVGTRFRVARFGEDATVMVERGTVEVLFRGATTRVDAGEQWTSTRPAAVTAVRVAEAELTGARAEPAAPEVTAPEVPAPAPAEPGRPVRSERPATGDRRAPAPAPARARDADRPASRDPDQAKFRQLEALEPRDPKAAIDGYLALSRGSSRWAERALFAAARLSADRKEPRARLLLEIYLQRFPTGANVDDARTLLGHTHGAPR